MRDKEKQIEILHKICWLRKTLLIAAFTFFLLGGVLITEQEITFIDDFNPKTPNTVLIDIQKDASPFRSDMAYYFQGDVVLISILLIGVGSFLCVLGNFPIEDKISYFSESKKIFDYVERS